MSSAYTDTVLASLVNSGGTFTVNYPAGLSGAYFTNAVKHKAYALGAEYSAPKDFTIAMGATNMTVTWNAATPLAANTLVRFNLDIVGADVDDDVPLNRQIIRAPFVGLSLGAPMTATANSIALSQAVAAGAAALLNGAKGAVLDVPRNVVAAWTGAAVLTLRGFDVDGQPVTETSASGTSHTGKKAFASLTEARFSAAVTAATIGCGLQIGLPCRITAASQLIYEVKNGVTAAPTGTTTAAITIASTGTTGDVRGTYAPLTPTDGLTAYTLVAVSNAPDDRGVPQYVA